MIYLRLGLGFGAGCGVTYFYRQVHGSMDAETAVKSKEVEPFSGPLEETADKIKNKLDIASKVTFYTTNKESFAYGDSFSLYGPCIFVQKNELLELTLNHELAHIQKNHVTKLDLVSSVWNGIIVSSLSLTRKNRTYWMALGSLWITKHIVKYILRNRFEREADETAIELTSNAGLANGVRFFSTAITANTLSYQYLPTMEKWKKKLSDLCDPHPTCEERIKSLKVGFYRKNEDMPLGLDVIGKNSEQVLSHDLTFRIRELVKKSKREDLLLGLRSIQLNPENEDENLVLNVAGDMPACLLADKNLITSYIQDPSEDLLCQIVQSGLNNPLNLTMYVTVDASEKTKEDVKQYFQKRFAEHNIVVIKTGDNDYKVKILLEKMIC